MTVAPVADPPRIVNLLPTMIQEDAAFSVCSTIIDPDTPEGPFVFQVCKPVNWRMGPLSNGQSIVYQLQTEARIILVKTRFAYPFVMQQACVMS